MVTIALVSERPINPGNVRGLYNYRGVWDYFIYLFELNACLTGVWISLGMKRSIQYRRRIIKKFSFFIIYGIYFILFTESNNWLISLSLCKSKDEK
jgi:hypothetical protein